MIWSWLAEQLVVIYLLSTYYYKFEPLGEKLDAAGL